MADELSPFKRELGVKWVKAESGTSYLCPLAALERLDTPNEADLKKICVDESLDPHNQ